MYEELFKLRIYISIENLLLFKLLFLIDGFLIKLSIVIYLEYWLIWGVYFYKKGTCTVFGPQFICYFQYHTNLSRLIRIIRYSIVNGGKINTKSLKYTFHTKLVNTLNYTHVL